MRKVVEEGRPKWLPNPEKFTEKIKCKNGKIIKNVATGTKYHSKKDVLSCATADNGQLHTPQTTNGHDNRLSSNDKVDAELPKTNDSPEWLPSGWKMEEKTRQSGFFKGATYKVYTEVTTGTKFYSEEAVMRYIEAMKLLETKNKRNRDANVEERRPDVSPSHLSMTNKDQIPGKKQKNSSFKTVKIEKSEADDLPPGWIKEIRISKCKSGQTPRRDPFYTDPVSHYVFRSQLDALRYLRSNDISSCLIRPLKRERYDDKLMVKQIPSESSASEKSSDHKKQLFPDGELIDDGGSSDTEIKAAKISKWKQDDKPDGIEVTAVGIKENSNENAEMENNPEPANIVSEEDMRESGMKKRFDRTLAESRKSEKRRDLSSREYPNWN